MQLSSVYTYGFLCYILSPSLEKRLIKESNYGLFMFVSDMVVSYIIETEKVSWMNEGLSWKVEIDFFKTLHLKLF